MSDSLRDRVAAAIGDQYEIECEIGRGGMSVVYRARDVRLDRTVAIKILPPDLAHDPAVRTRFAREAHTAAQLAHPHIIPIHDVGDRGGIAYFVMALVDGGNLASLLAHEPRQSIAETRRLVREMADALAYAHLRGVIHRDIKPDNILLDRDTGRAIVTDFGIARAVEAGTRLTATGIAVGTPAYMSPEQAVGDRQIDGRSDIYSLGVLAYQMVTGRLPFAAGNSMALLMKQVSEQPRPIAELRPDVPLALRSAIERALMKSPEDRWPSAAALREALGSGEMPAAAWRADHREPVRYTSPRRGSRAVEAPEPHPAAAGPAPGIVLEPPHLASLTPEQRTDLRLWSGRVNLLDRIRAARRYAAATVVLTFAGLVGIVAGVEEEIPPLIVLGPIVTTYMSAKLWRRALSLRERGLTLWRVFLSPRSRWVFPSPPRAPAAERLAKLATPQLLEGPRGTAIRRASDDRDAILEIVRQLPKPDRALLPDIEPTVDALVKRVADLALALDRLEESIDPRALHHLEARIAQLIGEGESPERERRLTLLRRQRATLQELIERRDALASQLDSAVLALGNLRLDLIKFRSSGVESALSDVSTATEEARTLSREIADALHAAASVRSL